MIKSFDRIVICVPDLRVACDDYAALFNGELGIRLALDQDVPQWGGRMLFFRTGKLTLEVIANQSADPAPP